MGGFCNLTRIRLRFVDRFTDRHGHVRHYFRRRLGPRTLPPGLPGSTAFMQPPSCGSALPHLSCALYVGWTIFYGGLTGWYPYPFVNAKRLDLWHLATNFMGLAFVALVVPYGLVALDRLLTTVRRQRA